MAVAYVTGTTRSTGNGASDSFAFDSSTGSNRILIVLGSMGTDYEYISSFTYNGVASSIAGTGSTARKFRMSYLIAPATGSNTLVMTYSSYGQNRSALAVFSGVDQSTPFPGSFSENSGNSSTPSTGSITCPANGMTYGGMHHTYINGGGVTATTGTLIGYVGGSGSQSVAHSYHNATGSLDFSQPTSGPWATGAIGIAAVAASTLAGPHKTILTSVRRASEY